MLPTLGVEEELFLVDPDSYAITARAARALRWHSEVAEGASGPHETGPSQVEEELYQQQIELASEPSRDLASLRASLVRARQAVAEAAGAASALAVAVPTPVLLDQPEEVTAKPRYQRIYDDYGPLAHQALVCGMHVHVEVPEDSDRVAVVDGVRPWLPVLLALSANSPYWCGSDTGYASWRSQVWSRWPTGGPREPFGSPEEYARTSSLMQEWGAAIDPGMLYFDVRLAAAHPTVEIRVADVCTEVDDAILVAGLARALVDTVVRRHRTRRSPSWGGWRSDLLRAAQWRAARFGMASTLVDPEHLRLAPAREVVLSLVEHCAESLEESGDRTDLVTLVDRMLARGPGAARQRAVLASRGSLEAVVGDLVERTGRR